MSNTYFPPAFPHPNRRINDKSSHFALDSEGYGSFRMDITVKFKDGTEEYYEYFIDLSKPWVEYPPSK
jgi:transcription initiation factor IIF auxiliary subunit